MKKQPDFTKLFYDYFGQSPKKVQYEVRPYANRYHDLIFLNSLIHDARFQRNKIKLRGRHLTIPINRDCWELKYTDFDNGSTKYSELHIANALLTITPIENIQWFFDHKVDFQPSTELWIHNLWIERQNIKNDTLILTIDGIDWKCTISVKDDGLKIKLRDVETPYLYSKQKTAEQAAAL